MNTSIQNVFLLESMSTLPKHDHQEFSKRLMRRVEQVERYDAIKILLMCNIQPLTKSKNVHGHEIHGAIHLVQGGFEDVSLQSCKVSSSTADRA